MKRLLFFICIFLSNIHFAQSNDIFDLARKGKATDIKSFIDENKEIDLNKSNSYGFTPLILACYYNNKEAVHFLIKKNVNLNYNTQEGTALMAVTVKGNVDLVKILLEKGANPDLTNDAGITALMYAVQFENKEIIELLLHYNANKYLLDTNGNSAFEYAIKTKNKEIINLLKI